MPSSNPACQPPPDITTCEGCFGNPGPSTLYWQQGIINEVLTEVNPGDYIWINGPGYEYSVECIQGILIIASSTFRADLECNGSNPVYYEAHDGDQTVIISS